MNIRQAYLSMIKAFQGGWDAMAPALGMTRDALENRIYERRGQSVLVETAMQMQEFSGTTYFAEAVAAASGGSFIKRPDLEHLDNEALFEKQSQLLMELGHWSKRFVECTADGEINPKEKAELSAIIDEIHKRTDELKVLTFKLYCHDADTADSQSKSE